MENPICWYARIAYGDNMGTLNIVLPDDVERKLRVAVAERGGKKGDLSGTVEEAIKEWLERVDERERKEKRK
jgi:hypothetical protein